MAVGNVSKIFSQSARPLMLAAGLHKAGALCFITAGLRFAQAFLWVGSFSLVILEEDLKQTTVCYIVKGALPL